MVKSLPYWLVFTMPLFTVAGFRAGGLWALAGVAYTFVAIPVFEALFGLRTDNEQTGSTGRRLWHDAPLMVWIPVQLAVQIYAVVLVATQGVPWWEALLIIVATGVMASGGGINIAHELMHRKTKLERGLSELLMASVTYTHFCIEHVYGHHRNVATALDPASAHKGENLYAFLPRTLLHGISSAWSIESKRCVQRGIPHVSLRHRMVRYGLTQFVIYTALGLTLGPIAVAFWLGQSLVAALLLETINYVEHYGLRRRELASGGYERIAPCHSWNAAHRLTNWLLFNLQRHSDHHFLASRPYYQLRHYDEVPQLPAGYATMILVALVPPLWRTLMDARVDAWNARTGDPAEKSTRFARGDGDTISAGL